MLVIRFQGDIHKNKSQKIKLSLVYWFFPDSIKSNHVGTTVNLEMCVHEKICTQGKQQPNESTNYVCIIMVQLFCGWMVRWIDGESNLFNITFYTLKCNHPQNISYTQKQTHNTVIYLDTCLIFYRQCERLTFLL